MDQTYMKEKPVVPLAAFDGNPGHHIDDRRGTLQYRGQHFRGNDQ